METLEHQELAVARQAFHQGGGSWSLQRVDLMTPPLMRDFMGDAEVAARNAPEQVVASGSTDAISALRWRLDAQPPTWLERAAARMREEPDTTAIVSTEVIEPGMPEAYINAPEMRPRPSK